MVKTNPNQNTFYSDASPIKEQIVDDSLEEVERGIEHSLSKEEKIQRIFANKSYSYTKRVRVVMAGRVFETRFVQEKQGHILTIDNELLNIDDIEAIDIL